MARKVKGRRDRSRSDTSSSLRTAMAPDPLLRGLCESLGSRVVVGVEVRGMEYSPRMWGWTVL